MESGFGLAPLDDHLAAPRRRGHLAGAPYAGHAGGAPCGDLVRVSVAVEEDRIVDAGFDASGCAAAIAAASATVELILDRPALEAARLDADSIAAALGGLSPERRHAAALAADALHAALGRAAAAGAIRLPASGRRTLVAMSGGVDSAVAAQVALERGDDVVAVTLELWADPAGDGTRSCCSPEAVLGARALAHRMGLPHITLDVRDRFRDEVVSNFAAEHAAGRTPNPCIRCNGIVRFDVMLALADTLGARLATGHYARIVSDGAGPLIASASARNKDQAYMLCRLRSDELERLWFPLGGLEKPQVREMARRAGLPVADKQESQDLCFLAGLGAQQFLELHGPRFADGFESHRPGDILDGGGAVVGRHDGQHRFTVGQRRGLGMAAGSPLYVTAKDAHSNTVTVGRRADLAVERVALQPAVLYRSGALVDRVKLRYRSDAIACRVEEPLEPGEHERAAIVLDEPAYGVAPGQTACLMQGCSVIGWGTIAGSHRAIKEADHLQETAHAG
jgi:tRNA-uridine 2-sulfurtransferase